MGPRQDTGQAALLGVFQKLDLLLNHVEESMDSSLSMLSNIEKIAKSEISTELKKQTTILASIESKLNPSTIIKPQDIKSFAPIVTGLVKMLELISSEGFAKSGEIFVSVFKAITETIQTLITLVDPEKIENIIEALSGISGTVAKLGLALSFIAILAPLILVGTAAIVVSIMAFKFLASGFLGPVAFKAIESLGIGVSKYAKTMVAAAVLAPIILIGTFVMSTSIATIQATILGLGVMAPLILTGSYVLKYLSASISDFSQEFKSLGLMGIAVLFGSYIFANTVRRVAKAMMQLSTYAPIIIAGSIIMRYLGKGIYDFATGLQKMGGIFRARLIRRGARVFVSVLNTIFSSLQEVSKEILVNMLVVTLLGQGAFAFALSLSLIVPLAPFALIGAKIYGITLNILTSTLKETAIDPKTMTKLVLSNLLMIYLVGMFTLEMTTITMMGKIMNFKIILEVVGLMYLFSGVLMSISKMSKDIDEYALYALFATMGEYGFAGALTYISKIKTINLQNVFLFNLAFYSFVYMLNKVGDMDSLYQGVVKTALAGLAVVVFSGAIAIVSKLDINLANIGLFVISMVMVGAAFALIGLADNLVERGTKALVAASLSLILFSIPLAIYKMIDFGVVDALVLGFTVGIIGLSFLLVGKFMTDVIKGSIAMMFAASVLLILSPALLIFKLTKFEATDILILGGTIAMLGLVMGLAGSVGAPRIGIGAIQIGMASIAILFLSMGLKTFKSINWNEDDSKNIAGALSGVIAGMLGYKSIGDIGAGALVRVPMMAGLLALSVIPMIAAGFALTLISRGLADFKKIQFNQKDADNIAYVLSSLTKPFYELGKAEAETSGWFSGGYISQGIGAISGLGTNLVNLAKGIQSFANLEVTEYEVKTDGKGNAIIAPKKITKMTKAMFKQAADNIKTVLGVVINEFAEVGKLEKQQEGWFAGGLVSTGINAIAGLGTNLVNLAKGVQAFANMEITEYEIIDAGTSNAKIVPKTIRKMTESDFVKAAVNIKGIIGFLAPIFAEIGKDEKEQQGWFEGGLVSTGIDSVKNLGTTVATLAEGIVKMSALEITENEVVDGQLVPKRIRKLTQADFEKARLNVQSILGFLVPIFTDIGKSIKNDETIIKLAVDSISSISGVMSNLVEPVKAWQGLDSTKAAKSISMLFGSLMDLFDPTKNTNVQQKDEYFTNFVENLQRLNYAGDNLTVIADNFERISNSMKLTKEHINNMDLKKLTMTDSMLKSLAIMSKSPEVIAGKLSESIEKAFEEFVAAIKELTGTISPGQPDVSNLLTNNNIQTTQTTQQQVQESKKEVQPVFNKADMIAALQAVTLKVKNVDKGGAGS